MLNTNNQKYIREVDRRMREARKIMGHLSVTTALFTITASMALDFADSVSEEAAIDFNRRFAKLTRKYPFYVSASEDTNRELNFRRAERLRQAWRDLRPRVDTRTVQITQYSTACMIIHYLHGDRARADFAKACLDWAARWEDDFQLDTGVKDATFDDSIADDVTDVDVEKSTKLVDPDSEDPLCGRTANDGLREGETN